MSGGLVWHAPRQVVVEHFVALGMERFAQYADARGADITPLDLLLWACYSCDSRLAQIFWRKCEQPCQAGLVASMLCKQLCARAPSQLLRRTLRAMAHKLEQNSKLVIDHCGSADAAAR